MRKETEGVKKGFTIIEVMLVLAITGLMLIGVLGNTYSSIKTQRYNDAVTSFAESLRQVYNEVLSPRSVDEAGGNTNRAIYGKAMIFDAETPGTFQVVTLVGDADLMENEDSGFVASLAAQNLHFECATSTTKNLFWEAQAYGSKTDSSASGPYSGTILIARSPRSGAIHTAAMDRSFETGDEASCTTSNTEFTDSLEDAMITKEPITFCVKSDESSVVRAVQIAADATNSSAINVLNEEDSQKVGCE